MFLFLASALSLGADPEPPPLPLPGPPPINLSHPAPPFLPPGSPAAGGPLAPPGWAAAQFPCPDPGAHPFQRLPRVCPVIPCPCDDGKCTDGCAHAGPLWTNEFLDAAHVPIPRFTADGQPVCLDGLLIYEGMRLTVYPNGVYDVSFTATIPEMPVTLRLQLVVVPPDEAREYRLTLPPLRFEPRADARPGDPNGNTFHVAHRGYSGVFALHQPRRPATPGGAGEVNYGWTVTRVGTARFGTPVAVSDPSR